MAFPLSAFLRYSPPLYPPHSTPSFSLFKKQIGKQTKEGGGGKFQETHTYRKFTKTQSQIP